MGSYILTCCSSKKANKLEEKQKKLKKHSSTDTSTRYMQELNNFPKFTNFKITKLYKQENVEIEYKYSFNSIFKLYTNNEELTNEQKIKTINKKINKYFRNKNNSKEFIL